MEKIKHNSLFSSFYSFRFNIIFIIVIIILNHAQVFGQHNFKINVTVQRPGIFKDDTTSLRDKQPIQGAIRMVPASFQLMEVYHDMSNPKLVSKYYTDANGTLDNLPFSCGEELPNEIKIVVLGKSSLGFTVGTSSDNPLEWLDEVWDYKWEGPWIPVNSDEVDYPTYNPMGPKLNIGSSNDFFDPDFKAAALVDLISCIYQEFDLNIESKWNVKSRAAEAKDSNVPWVYWRVVHLNPNLHGNSVLYYAPHELGHVIYNFYHSDKEHYFTDDMFDYLHTHNACDDFGAQFGNYEGFANAFHNLFWCHHAQRHNRSDYDHPDYECGAKGISREGNVTEFYSYVFAGIPMKRPPESLENWTTHQIGANLYAFPPTKSFFSIGKELPSGYHLEDLFSIYVNSLDKPEFHESPEGIPSFFKSKRFSCLAQNTMLASDDPFHPDFKNVDCNPGISDITNTHNIDSISVRVEFTHSEPVDTYYVVITSETGNIVKEKVDVSNQNLLDNLIDTVTVPFYESYQLTVETEYDGITTNGNIVQQRGVGFLVNTNDDVDDGICDLTHCSLREAINASNLDPRMNMIHFNLSGSTNDHTIKPLSSLPFITDPILINGLFQTSSLIPQIQLDGSDAGTCDGIVIKTNNCIVNGLKITGFSSSGIVIEGGNDNIITGNYIGNNGFLVSSNNNGVIISDGASGNQIGGTNSGNRNVISGNNDSGIGILREANGNFIQGNYIGTNNNAYVSLPNTDGIWLGEGAINNIIGGVSPEECNIISGNRVFGVSINHNETTGNKVIGNYIGTDDEGINPIPNGAGGVVFTDGANNNAIGGNVPGSGNLIAFNEGPGIKTHVDVGNGNLFLFNRIHSNDGLGIDLLDDSETLNDLGDVDTGPNGLQNFPVLSNAKSGYINNNLIPEIYSTVDVSINSTSDTPFLIQLFKNSEPDPSNYGEGEIYLTNFILYTDEFGNANMDEVEINAVPGEYITATARDNQNNSSEFSQCIQVEMALVEWSGIVAQEETETSETTLADGMSSVTFSSQWPGSDVVMTLISPVGRIINRDTEANDVIHEIGPTSEKYRILHPKSGCWKVELFGADVEADGEEVRLKVSATPDEPVKTMPIDILPGDEINIINCSRENGVIPVAILTTENFDATTIDHTTVRFGRFGNEAGEKHVHKKSGEVKRHENDVDDDGDMDLVFHFSPEKTGIKCGDEIAVMTGSDYNGQIYIGIDQILTTLKNKKNADEQIPLPKEYVINLCYPNPFNPTTTINYQLGKNSQVEISIYDINGKKVETLIKAYQNIGSYSVEWNASQYPSGIYIYKIIADEFVDVNKILLLK